MDLQSLRLLAIDAQHLSKTFQTKPGQVEAVQDVSVAAAPGDIFWDFLSKWRGQMRGIMTEGWMAAHYEGRHRGSAVCTHQIVLLRDFGEKSSRKKLKLPR